ncbi:hypothetical protein [uncultured Tateyamaria sp.]|uniref:hypothetical protein n=1 Tax=uncultured Tateyamaria sp. TaxID=455651 RepID=UPI002621686A|nr:hypothetical protein [uncultured Tateyamaria sp.]
MSKEKKPPQENTPEVPFVIGARNTQLRDPLHESWLAKQIRPWGETANLVRNSICNTVLDWHEEDRLIKARLPKPKNMPKRVKMLDLAPVTLNIARMEWTGEQVVYDVKDLPVFIDLGVPLLSLEEAFRSSSRRTLNRQFEKMDDPSSQSVSKSLLSLMFWEDVAVKIDRYRREELTSAAE